TVVVGDIEVDRTVTELVAAAGEALVNAAKFSGEDRVSLYAEVSDEAVEVFVRDRGVGFELKDIPGDRHGVRDSIMGRMKRIGGSGEVISEPGVGTEIELRLPRQSGGAIDPGASEQGVIGEPSP
ncbi:MAG: sensor histidine kinase, partial [Acidimicrobiales bacterium]